MNTCCCDIWNGAEWRQFTVKFLDDFDCDPPTHLYGLPVIITDDEGCVMPSMSWNLAVAYEALALRKIDFDIEKDDKNQSYHFRFSKLSGDQQLLLERSYSQRERFYHRGGDDDWLAGRIFNAIEEIEKKEKELCPTKPASSSQESQVCWDPTSPTSASGGDSTFTASTT